jgi:D-aminoacyl-tRNA deacylase
MRAVVQRVSSASVSICDQAGESEVARIGHGLLVLLGVERGDGPSDAAYLAAKISELRVFEDAAEPSKQINRSVRDVGGAVLVVPQFTLAGDCRKGRRPSFDSAAPPEIARPLYERVVDELRGMHLAVQTGRFQATMRVSLTNEGPVTLLLDSRKTF